MLTVSPVDNVWVHIDASTDVLKELSDYFTFDPPGAAFIRRQAKYRGWDGKVRLFKLKSQRLYRGLIPRVQEFAEARGYNITNDVPTPDPLWKHLDAFLEALDLPFEPDDYQIAALRALLDRERGIILSPTGSGKSYVIYLLTQALADVNTLIIVPTLGLIAQMVKNFAEYGYTPEIHTIHGGQSKTSNTQVTVSTWQSLYEEPPEYFDRYDCVIVDEVHGAKAKSLVGIMERCTARYRFGFTGTLDNQDIHRLQLEGLFGDIIQVATTHDLVKKGRLAAPRVHMCILKYPVAFAKKLRHKAYDEELDIIVQTTARNEFLARLALETVGNCLVLCQFIEHGQVLAHRIQELAKGTKQVHYIAGSVDIEDRERIRLLVETGDHHIIVGSYGTVQLGVNIPSLRNLIFAHPAKGQIRVIQSLGRILRLAEGKDRAMLYDVVDDLRVGKAINHLWRHGEARQQYYATEKFPVSLKVVDLEQFVRMIQRAQEPLGASTVAQGSVDPLSGSVGALSEPQNVFGGI
jgi:superfamily II DNA or RNA helicase